VAAAPVLALDDGFYFFRSCHWQTLELITLIDADNPRTPPERRQMRPPRPFFRRRHGRQGRTEKLRQSGASIPTWSVTKVDDGIICSNGPCWSPDNRTFYFADTFQREYWAYDYDIDTGGVSNNASSPT